jgi:hypothetical protein
MLEEKLDNVEKTLNIRKGERFNVKGWNYGSYTYDGAYIQDGEGCCMGGEYTLRLINHPEWIEKIPQKIVVSEAVWSVLEGIRKMGGRYIYKDVNGRGDKCVVVYTDSRNKTFKHGSYIGEIFIKELINFMQEGEEFDVVDILSGNKFIEGD